MYAIIITERNEREETTMKKFLTFTFTDINGKIEWAMIVLAACIVVLAACIVALVVCAIRGDFVEANNAAAAANAAFNACRVVGL